MFALLYILLSVHWIRYCTFYRLVYIDPGSLHIEHPFNLIWRMTNAYCYFDPIPCLIVNLKNVKYFRPLYCYMWVLFIALQTAVVQKVM